MSEKRALEEAPGAVEKKIKLENGLKKYVLFPVSTIGCGKTTIGVALQKLILCGLVQNDEIADSKHSFETAVLESLRENDIVYADRNNHMIRERSSFLDTVKSFKDQYFLGDVEFILLDFLSDKENIKDDHDLWALTESRVVSRGLNHQSIKTDNKHSIYKAKDIMNGFVQRYEKVDPSKYPDEEFTTIVPLSVTTKDSSRQNLDTILKALEDIVGKIDQKKVSQAFEEALSYKSNKRKAFLKTGGSFVYEVPSKQFSKKAVGEADVGITTYILPEQLAFSGTLKQRYTDFLVNEIGVDGEVVHLTDAGFPIEDKKPKKPREKSDEPKLVEITVSDEDKEELIKIFGEEDFNLLMENVIGKSRKLVSTKKFTDKKERTEVHQQVRRIFNGKLETSTDLDNAIIVTVAKSGNKSRSNDNRAKNQNAFGLGPKKAYLHFVLYKQNKDTMEAANMICKFTRLNPRSIRYAGTKDRRAVTVQKMCIAKGDVTRINSLNKQLRGIKLGSFSYSDEGINLGDLKGNEFVITIRNVQTSGEKPVSEIVDENFQTLKEKGFINYYGMQRFGTFSVSTHEVGREILLNNWKGAVELILSNQEFVLPESVEAREIWEATRNPNYALSFMPKKCLAETCILKELCTFYNGKTDLQNGHYFQALNKIPRNLRMMYGHAYQSYVWNAVASKRIELFGLTVVAGDLVISESSNVAEEDVLEGGEDVKKETFVRARPITQDEIDQGKYTIYDVVLPTPGFDIVYPENAQLKEVYVQVMAKDGLDPFKMARNVREFSYAGSYRNVVTKPTNLDYYVRNYEDDTAELVRDDLAILEQNGTFDESKRVMETDQGSKTAVIVKMGLPTSCYATMALRELMKIDTTRRSESFDVKN